jgi:hypothetical protein
MNNVVKTHTVKIGGRSFDLAFTLAAVLKMEKNIEGFNLNEINKLVATSSGMLKVLYILAQCGEALAERKMDVDEEWFALHIPVNAKKLVSIQVAIMETLADGMSMETEEEEEENQEVDVVLQEIQKKSGKTV